MTAADRLSAALAGRYRIERELGAGGMATVFLAHDEKHDRKVAIKVLKPELAAVLGAERFVVEIKTTASLSHPHILPLFDSGTADGFLFYVMPYIEGETIRDKLNRETQFGVDEAVRIAREVGDALDYAHRRGVIHRDIKPENILLHDGRAMVMDFGIALAVSAAAGGRMTETGLSLGTPHYMSPEQATAERELTPRSDVYSLASVLYEMLAGDPPFVASAAQAVIMKIITEPAAPVTGRRKNVPDNVEAALAKALEKLPADRFESAKAFADALANPAFTAEGAPARSMARRDGRGGVNRTLFAVVTAVAVIATVGMAWALLRPVATFETPVVRAALEFPPGERLYDGFAGTIAISPQGDRIAYATAAGGGRTFIRRTSELAGRALVTGAAWGNMTFSPDGNWLAYTVGSSNRIMKVPVDGGASVQLGTMPNGTATGLSWTRDNTIVIGSVSGLWTIPATGGAIQRLTTDSVELAVTPLVLPDGKTLLCTTGATDDLRHLAVVSLATKKAVTLSILAVHALGYRDGHLLYVTRAGALMAVPFDLGGLRVTGDPVPILENIRLAGGVRSAIAVLSPSGTLFYLSGASESRLVYAAEGRPDVPLLPEARDYNAPRFSPDGRKVAVTVTGPNSTSDIWVYDLGAHTFAQLTSGGGNGRPEWTPDGSRVLFRSARRDTTSFWWQPADQSTKAELLYKPDEPVNEAIVSPDGKWLVYRTSPGARDPADILAVPLAGDKRTPTPLVSSPFTENLPRLSPDGRWMAYQSNESGRFEIYVRPFPGAGARVQVSTEGGTEPIWARSGRALFYRTATGITSVAVTTGASFAIGDRRVALEGEFLSDPTHANYDVAPDGSRFLMLRQAGTSMPIMVHNWGREFKEKLAGGKK